MTVNASHIHGEVVFRRHGFQTVHGWREPPEDWLLAGTKALSNDAPSGIADLQAAMPDGVLALHLAWLGNIAFADGERVSRHSHFAGERVGNRTNNLASVRSSLRSAA